MSTLPDPLADWLMARMEQGWARLLFSMAFSHYVTFLYTWGDQLRQGKWFKALGVAMVKSAVVLTALFRRETGNFIKGMVVALPGEEATEELNTKLQIITRS